MATTSDRENQNKFTTQKIFKLSRGLKIIILLNLRLQRIGYIFSKFNPNCSYNCINSQAPLLFLENM